MALPHLLDQHDFDQLTSQQHLIVRKWRARPLAVQLGLDQSDDGVDARVMLRSYGIRVPTRPLCALADDTELAWAKYDAVM